MKKTHATLRFEFEHLGILDHAELELGDLTIVCGKNNTGKTYVAYGLYGFLKSWQRLTSDYIGKLYRVSFAESNTIGLDLDEIIFKKWDHHLKEMSLLYQKVLPKMLAINVDRLKDTKVLININPPLELKDQSYDRSIRLFDNEPFLNINKASGSLLVNIVLLKNVSEVLPASVLNEIIAAEIQNLCFKDALPFAFMASSERTGATIFRDELNLSRTRRLESMTSFFRDLVKDKKHSKMKIPEELLAEAALPYSLPVRDEIEFVNKISSLESEKSELCEKRPDMLLDFAELLGGEYKIINRNIFFVPAGSRGVELTLNESSSAVKSLVDVMFYLRHKAKKGDLLMIDEPELNLHPAAQRKIARIIARLVNYGIKVFITTHSDYIAKEINTLLLMNKAGKKYAGELGYKDDELLVSSKVHLYIAQEVSETNGEQKSTRTLSRLDPLEEGAFEYPSFDETIDDMNRVFCNVCEHINSTQG